jgi:hypothetical protein
MLGDILLFTLGAVAGGISIGFWGARAVALERLRRAQDVAGKDRMLAMRAEEHDRVKEERDRLRCVIDGKAYRPRPVYRAESPILFPIQRK